MALGINSEETIFSPFIGSLKNFELIIRILSIIIIIIPILYLSYKYKEQGKLIGVGIYFSSFVGLYLMLVSTDLLYIIVGLFFLIISIKLVSHSK